MKEMCLHVLSNSQSMTFFLLDESYSNWLNKMGKVNVPDDILESLFLLEDNIEKDVFVKEMNKEVFRSLVDNDFGVLDGIYKALKFPDFPTVMELVDFVIKNDIKIIFERYDISEGL